MGYIAKHRYAPISARKARLVVDMVRGKTVDDALNICKFCRKRAAHLVGKVLASAQANAREGGLAPHELFVSMARADDGPTRKGFMPKSRGSSGKILSHSSHITVEIDTVAAGGTEGEE